MWGLQHRGASRGAQRCRATSWPLSTGSAAVGPGRLQNCCRIVLGQGLQPHAGASREGHAGPCGAQLLSPCPRAGAEAAAPAPQIFTRLGKCYTFNSGQPGTELLTTLQGGAGNGLELMLNIQQEEYLPVWGDTGEDPACWGGGGGGGQTLHSPALPCRRDVLRGGGEGADPQPAGAPLHRPAGLRGGARLPDLRVLPAAAGIRHPPCHAGAPQRWGAPGPLPGTGSPLCRDRAAPGWGRAWAGPSRGAAARGRCCSGSGTAAWGSPVLGPRGPCRRLGLCPPPPTIPPRLLPSSLRAGAAASWRSQTPKFRCLEWASPCVPVLLVWAALPLPLCCPPQNPPSLQCW